MINLKPVEIKAFIPAKNFDISKKFYQEIGFVMASDSNGIAYFHFEQVSFLLQNFYVKEFAENLMMHLLVESVDSWYQTLLEKKIADKIRIKILPPETRSWGMRDFAIRDPSGVLWRIGENVEGVLADKIDSRTK